MGEPYRTVDRRGRAAFRERGSRFIGHVAPAEDVDAAEQIIDEIAADHPDATHVVPAYRIRGDPLLAHHADDGEPGGSAGAPMGTVLAGEDLDNVVAVVVRYFGGTELGVGGLVRAYGEAVKRALAATEIVTRRPTVRLTIETSYDDSGTVRSILEASEATFSARYRERVRFQIGVVATEADALRDRVLSATSGRAAID